MIWKITPGGVKNKDFLKAGRGAAIIKKINHRGHRARRDNNG